MHTVAESYAENAFNDDGHIDWAERQSINSITGLNLSDAYYDNIQTLYTAIGNAVNQLNTNPALQNPQLRDAYQQNMEAFADSNGQNIQALNSANTLLALAMLGGNSSVTSQVQTYRDSQGNNSQALNVAVQTIMQQLGISQNEAIAVVNNLAFNSSNSTNSATPTDWGNYYIDENGNSDLNAEVYIYDYVQDNLSTNYQHSNLYFNNGQYINYLVDPSTTNPEGNIAPTDPLGVLQGEDGQVLYVRSFRLTGKNTVTYAEYIMQQVLNQLAGKLGLTSNDISLILTYYRNHPDSILYKGQHMTEQMWHDIAISAQGIEPWNFDVTLGQTKLFSEILGRQVVPQLPECVVNVSDNFSGTPIQTFDAPISNNITPHYPSMEASTINPTIVQMSSVDKIKDALFRALKYMPQEAADKLLALFSSTVALTIIAVALVAWIANHIDGASEILDVILIGAGIGFLGADAILAAQDLYGFVTKALDAKNENDLEEAGKLLAHAIATIGIDALLVFLTHQLSSISSETEAESLLNKIKNAEENEIIGTAKLHTIGRLEWATNPNGEVRTIEEAIAIARANGVEIPDWVKFFARDSSDFETNTFASYGGVSKEVNIVEWDKLFVNGKMPVRFDRSILSSDEAIVEIFGHEIYEINKLKPLFDANDGIMTNTYYYRLVDGGNGGTLGGALHEEAIDASRALVLEMRKDKP